jgi:hypothetical protein
MDGRRLAMMKKWRRKGFVLGLCAAVESQTQLMIMCFSLERDHSKSGCPAAACSPTDSICRTVALSDLKLNVSLFWFETRWVCRVLYHRLECGARCGCARANRACGFPYYCERHTTSEERRVPICARVCGELCAQLHRLPPSCKRVAVVNTKNPF